MSSSSATETVERVCLNLRVSKSVKEAYESVIAEEYGRKRPYTGTELERELRFALGEGTVSDLYDAVSDLGEAFGEAPREKKNLSTPNDETAVVGYRVSESVRRGIMSLASGTTCTNPGEFVERIMQSYAAGESVDERLINLTDRIKQATDHKFNDDLSAIEKRTKAIAAEIDADEFTIDDFDEAVEEVPKITPSRHIREQYLSRVLDELDATWLDRDWNTHIFTTRDDVPPEAERDHRNKPYLLMDNADKRLAIKTGFIESSDNVYTESEAMGALQNKPQPKTVRKLMRQIGETDGFRYRDGSDRRTRNADDVLRMNRDAALSSSDHDDLARVLMDTDGTQWVQEIAGWLSDLPSLPNDAAIKHKIAYNTTDYNVRALDNKSNFLDAITDEQVARVQQYAADSTEEAASTPVEGRGNTGETTIQQPDNGQNKSVEASSSTTPARTDGGHKDE